MQTLWFYFEIMMKAVVINSRQCRIMLSSDGWIKATIEAVRFAVENGWSIVTSIGLKPHELSLWAGAEAGAELVILVPENADRDSIIEDFELVPEKVQFLGVEGKGRGWWKLRDRKLFELSDVIIPVSIREQGNMSRLMREFSGMKRTIPDFAVPYNGDCKGRMSRPEIDRILEPAEWKYVTHWVHTTFEPHPGENKRKFYKKILNARGFYPYSAFENLKSILKDGKIYGSHNFRGGLKGVSFTGLSPRRSAEFMRWRPSKGRFYWEPYGIAIKAETALEYGIKPVIYGDETDYARLSERQKPYFQPVGKRRQWIEEREYRFIGDFDLNRLPEGSFVAVVPTKKEAVEVESLYDVRTIVVEN